MIFLFWSSLAAVLYAYLGYPLLLWVISRLRRPRPSGGPGPLPRVTLIVAVHNERERVEEKIRNTLRLRYPPELLEVFFSSDASSDGTDEIVAGYRERNIRLVRAEERKGKEYAQKLAIERASGDILGVTDVATLLQEDGLRAIVANFADPTVGCVSSEDRFLDENDRICAEGLYVRYEMLLRTLESRVHSVVGLSGSFFAARRELCSAWPTELPSDFHTLLHAVRLGYRGVSDPASIGLYRNITDEKKEFQRKVRTVTRGIAALAANRDMLNVPRRGFFAFQLISHKLLRWSVPLFLLLLLASNLWLAPSGAFFAVLLLLQVLFYVSAIAYGTGMARTALFRIPYYFCVVNAAIASAWIRYLRGQRFATWTPTRRSGGPQA